jgi:hypothetical protein
VTYRSRLFAVTALLLGVIIAGTLHERFQRRSTPPEPATLQPTAPSALARPAPQPLSPAQLLELRRRYVAETEDEFLMDGQDVYLSLDGKNQDELRINYILMSRPKVHQLSRNADFIQTLRKIGFVKVHFTDGFDDNWTLNLR